ncbi:reverse transcriptase domain-containing protein [Artemisia annua]|uniref:Reverse transcriptase domain-containing protein n=1 Tax=Artemisia annua TaxID=35608 RepID=A0A2U1QDT5_ARTAN|nr:reverse transcriptase domain-containing protein [Artemisia annua]
MVNNRRNRQPNGGPEEEEQEIPNLEAMVAAAIANMLPGLNANEVISRLIHDMRNGAGSSGGSSSSGGRPTNITGWLERFMNDAARNIEIFHEGSGYKRSRDGDRIQHRAQGDSSKGDSGRGDYGRGPSGRGHDSRGQSDRGRADQATDYQGRSDRATDQRGQPNRSSGSSGQQRPTEVLPPPPLFPTCGKPHPGQCRKLTGECYRCASNAHRVKDCSKGNFTSSANTPRLPAPSGRVFTTTRDQAAGTSGTITGILYFGDHTAFVLFDTGATHYIISTTFSKKLKLTPTPLMNQISISTPMKDHPPPSTISPRPPTPPISIAPDEQVLGVEETLQSLGTQTNADDSLAAEHVTVEAHTSVETLFTAEEEHMVSSSTDPSVPAHTSPIASGVQDLPADSLEELVICDDDLYNRIKTRLHHDGLLTPHLAANLSSIGEESPSQNFKLDEVEAATVSDASLSHTADDVSIAADPTAIVASSVLYKGKAKVVEEDVPSKKRTRRQMEEDRLGEEAAKLLHDDQQADLARIHEIKVREVELAAPRDAEIRMKMDANVAAEVSADVPLVPSSVETHESANVSATEPSSHHSSKYIPGIGLKYWAYSMSCSHWE